MGKYVQNQIEKIFTYQKKAARVIFFADRLVHTKPLMLDMNALNVYQINIYQNLILLYKAHTGTAPSIFFNKFSKINHNLPTSSKNSGNYTIPKSTMKLTNFSVSRRSPILWNIVLDETIKRNRIFLYHYSQQKSKKYFSHVTTSFRSFNDFKLNDLLNYILLLSYVIIRDSLYYS